MMTRKQAEGRKPSRCRIWKGRRTWIAWYYCSLIPQNIKQTTKSSHSHSTSTSKETEHWNLQEMDWCNARYTVTSQVSLSNLGFMKSGVQHKKCFISSVSSSLNVFTLWVQMSVSCSGRKHSTVSVSHLCSLAWPTHTRPPCLGEGLLQDLWRTSKPISQLVLHWPHDDQGVQPPFLRDTKDKINAFSL